MTVIIDTLTKQLIDDKRLLTWRYVADEYSMKRDEASQTLHNVVSGLSGTLKADDEQKNWSLCMTYTRLPRLTDSIPRVRSHVWIQRLEHGSKLLPSQEWLLEKFDTDVLHAEVYLESMAVTHDEHGSDFQNELENLQHVELRAVSSLFLHAMNANCLYIPRSNVAKITIAIKPRRRARDPEPLRPPKEMKKEEAKENQDQKMMKNEPLASATLPPTFADTKANCKREAEEGPARDPVISPKSTKQETTKPTEKLKHSVSKRGKRSRPLFDPDEDAELSSGLNDGMSCTSPPQVESVAGKKIDSGGCCPSSASLTPANEDTSRVKVDTPSSVLQQENTQSVVPSAQLMEDGDGFVYKKGSTRKEEIRFEGPNAEQENLSKSKSSPPLADNKKKSAGGKRQHSQMGLEAFFKGPCKRQKNNV